MYIISLLRPEGEKDGKNRYYQSDYESQMAESHNNEAAEFASYGSFRCSKQFRVTDEHGATEDVNGIIVQHVRKTPTVRFKKFLNAEAEPREYDAVADKADPESIEKSTNQAVKYMWDEYFEIFIIQNGRSIEVDSFQNGPLCTHQNLEDGEKEPIVEEDESDIEEFPYINSRGTIVVVGRSIFIPLDVLPPLTTEAERERSNIDIKNFLPISIKNLSVNGQRWSARQTSPANGLCYLPFNAAANTAIGALAESEPFTHTVTVTWGFPGPTHIGQRTHYVSVPPIPPPVAGVGGRRKTRRRARYTRR